MYHTVTCNAVTESVVPTNASWTLRISDKRHWSQQVGGACVYIYIYINDWMVRD
jgi:hypothetical protein